jgi:hypothetical protein
MSRPEHPSERLRDALRQLAEADAAELIAAARERARARASKTIEDAMVEELLAAAARAPGARARAPHTGARPPHAEAQDGAGDAWWTYCVLFAADAANIPGGLEGIEPPGMVEVLREDDLAALVSRVPTSEYNDARLREHLEDLAWVERTARRHEAVLEAALAHVTIVPLRLCTIYLDEQGVRRFLREHAASLERSLAKVEGCAEWGVKLFADESAPEPENEDAPAASTVRAGAAYLAQRQRARERSERASELRASCAEAVHERISMVAREATVNPPQRPELHGREMTMLLNGAYLVANDRVAELHEAARALQAEWGQHGFVIELTGPWPAYNFVSGAGVMP